MIQLTLILDLNN